MEKKKVVENAKKAAEAVKTETGYIAEKAKLKVKIMKERSKLEELYGELGRLIYKQTKEDAKDDDALLEVISRIDIRLATVDNLKIRLRIAEDKKKKGGVTVADDGENEEKTE